MGKWDVMVGGNGTIRSLGTHEVSRGIERGEKKKKKARRRDPSGVSGFKLTVWLISRCKHDVDYHIYMCCTEVDVM